MTRIAAALALAALATSCGGEPPPETAESFALSQFATNPLLAGARAPRVVGAQSLAPEPVVAVDVEASLPGGGTARYSLDVRRLPGGSFELAALSGPGIAWPEPPPSSGEGLSVSPPPR